MSGGDDPVAAAGGSADDSTGAGPGGVGDAALEATAAEEVFAEEAGVPATPTAGGGEPDDEGREVPVGDPVATAVAVVAHERDEYRDALQRLQADFENYKKRVAKQSEEVRERAAESLVEALLPVLDTADLALAHGGGEDVKQIVAGLYSALEKEGLSRIDEQRSPFDPTLHDAVAHEPGEGGGQEVAEVFRAGYRWRGRVLRPAMVKVRG